jgi:ubiquinone/menaquinone biosynthesis C-methylase UbiE
MSGDKHQGNHNERHEHHGKSSKGMFDDERVLRMIGLKERQTFMDGGCADGHFSISASKIVGEKGKVFAVDIHEPSLRLLSKEIEDAEITNIVVLKRDLRDETQFSSGSLDHFFMSNVMHGFVYNGETDKVLEVISKSLRKGGTLSLVEWDKNNVVNGPPKDHRLSYPEAIGLLQPCGLEPHKMVTLTEEHVLMIFKKP